MSTKQKPAFPCTNEQMHAPHADPGMSLRDWFAGQQMVRIGSGWPNEDNMRLIAANCYAMADAMLVARSTSQEQTGGQP